MAHPSLPFPSLTLKVHGAGRVQVSLIAEAVLWKRGILVMPPIVKKLVQAMQVTSIPPVCPHSPRYHAQLLQPVTLLPCPSS